MTETKKATAMTMDIKRPAPFPVVEVSNTFFGTKRMEIYSDGRVVKVEYTSLFPWFLGAKEKKQTKPQESDIGKPQGEYVRNLKSYH